MEPIRALDLMRRYHILREPRIDGDRYDIDKLEFTEEFNESMNETFYRLKSDPTNESLNLEEGLRSILDNFIGKNENITNDEKQKIKIMVFSLKMVEQKSK